MWNGFFLAFLAIDDQGQINLQTLLASQATRVKLSKSGLLCQKTYNGREAKKSTTGHTNKIAMCLEMRRYCGGKCGMDNFGRWTSNILFFMMIYKQSWELNCITMHVVSYIKSHNKTSLQAKRSFSNFHDEWCQMLALAMAASIAALTSKLYNSFSFFQKWHS